MGFSAVCPCQGRHVNTRKFTLSKIPVDEQVPQAPSDTDEIFEKRPLLPNLGACLCRAYLPFQRDRQARQTGQAQILILEILQCIPVVKIFAFLDLEQN